MEIQFTKPNHDSVLIPLLDNGSSVHLHLAEYLVKRFHYPSLISLEMKRVKSQESIKTKAYHLKRFLENLDANNLDYINVEYSQLYKVIELMCETHKDHKTFNHMYANVREFYDFLNSIGVRVNAAFPDKVEKERRRNDDYNLLPSTYSQINMMYKDDSGIKPTQILSSYKDRVFSKKQADRLYVKLSEIDPVYEIIAKVMLQTFLRISNICEMPFRNDSRNSLMLYPELESLGIERQKLTINAKGQKVYSIPLYQHTSRLIFEEYIEPYFDERKKLFINKYLHRKNATLFFGQGSRKVPDDVLWLTKNGVPVKPFMIDDAFKEAGLEITPHMCRHTGVTHVMYSFCKMHNIRVCDSLAARFTRMLQELLGHVSEETTLLYIHTIEDMESLQALQYSIPTDKLEIDKALSEHISKKVLDDVERWYNGCNPPSKSL